MSFFHSKEEKLSVSFHACRVLYWLDPKELNLSFSEDICNNLRVSKYAQTLCVCCSFSFYRFYIQFSTGSEDKMSSLWLLCNAVARPQLTPHTVSVFSFRGQLPASIFIIAVFLDLLHFSWRQWSLTPPVPQPHASLDPWVDN